MRTPHKFADAIKAWADGHDVQYRSLGSVPWHDLSNPFNGIPAFNAVHALEWRVKSTEYRVYLRNGSVYAITKGGIKGGNPENYSGFERWLGPWTEFEPTFDEDGQ
jgi:hypothetical protein